MIKASTCMKCHESHYFIHLIQEADFKCSKEVSQTKAVGIQQTDHPERKPTNT